LKNLLLLLFMTITFTATGCIYHNFAIPENTNRIANYQLTTDDFKIIGTVRAEGEIHNLFFLFSWGGNGFIEIEKKAISLGGDDIINYTFDTEKTGFLFFVYNSYKWTARATVIKYTDKAIDRIKWEENLFKFQKESTSQHITNLTSATIDDIPDKVKDQALKEMTIQDLEQIIHDKPQDFAQRLSIDTVRKLHKFEKLDKNK